MESSSRMLTSKRQEATWIGSEREMVVKTTRITVETDTLTVVRHARMTMAWCPDCGAEVEVITLDANSFSEPATAAQVREWLATGKLHLWWAAEGPAQFCLTSLLQCFEPEEVRRLGCSDQNDPPETSRRKQKCNSALH